MRISHVILQGTPFCNIDCKYCYLPDRANKSIMAMTTVRRAFGEIFSSGFVHRRLNIVWHAGEPLVLGVGFYEQAIQVIEDLAPADIKLTHSMNTNGMLIDRDWCAFFKAHRVNLGISIDGPKDLHDANRVTRTGRGSFDKAVAGLRRLRETETPFYVITVLTRGALSRARDLYEFYTAEGVHTVCFNIDEVEGVNQHSSMQGVGAEAMFAAFLREFWSLVAQDGGRLKVREFENMLRDISWPPSMERPHNETDPLGHLNIDWRGNFSTFSPELLGHRSEKYGNFLIGNFATSTLSTALQSKAFLEMSADIQQGVGLCRDSCSYFSICGGGAPSNKLNENGTFASSETMFCRLTKKVLADVMLGIIGRVAEAEYSQQDG